MHSPEAQPSLVAAPPLPLQPPDAAAASRRAILLRCLALAAFTYLVHFLYSARFGLYEDDFIVFPAVGAWHLADVLTWIGHHFRTFEHGRPVSYAIWALLPWIGFQVGNLHAVYAVCSLVVCANVVLFYLLLRRCFDGDEFVAVVGALLYCLYPADTTRALLVHTNLLQPAILFALLGAHCYLSRRYVPAYVFAALTLLSYESALLPFLFIPLLRPTLDRRAVRRFLLHAALCAALFCALGAFRLAIGEGRVEQASASPATLLFRMTTSWFIGPWTCLRLLFADSHIAFKYAKEYHTLLPMLLSLPVTLAFLLTTPLPAFSNPQSAIRNHTTPLLVALVMLAASYSLAISPAHYPPTAEYGRLTSVHLAACLAASLLVALLVRLILTLLHPPRLRLPALFLAAAGLSTLVGFAFFIQQGFVFTLQDQRAFWSDVVRLCPDLQDGTVILVDGQIPVRRKRMAAPNSWSDGLVLPDLFQFPDSFQHPPILMRAPLGGSWTNVIQPGPDGKLTWALWPRFTPYPALKQPVTSRHVILLHAANHHLSRITGTLSTHGVPMTFPAPPTTTPPSYPPGPLYPLLLTHTYPARILKIPSCSPLDSIYASSRARPSLRPTTPDTD